PSVVLPAGVCASLTSLVRRIRTRALQRFSQHARHGMRAPLVTGVETCALPIPCATRPRRCPPLSQCFQPADWQAIAAAVRQGVDIGAQSTTHRRLPRLTEAERQREVIMRRRALESKIGCETHL